MQIVRKRDAHEYTINTKATVKEFYDFWRYIVMIQQNNIAYGTYTAYRNIINNYIIPFMGNSKLCNVNRGMLIQILNEIKYPSVSKQAVIVFSSSFRYAKAKNFISFNPANEINKAQNRTLLKTQQIKKPRPTLTLEMAIKAIRTCKEKENSIFLPILFSVTMGLRISEAIGLKYSDIDFSSNEAHIQRQLGRKVDDNVNDSGLLTKQELNPKSYAGNRIIPVPQFVLVEIILAREIYERNREENIFFHDFNYIWCHDDGSPYDRGDYAEPFKRVLKYCEFPDMHWHDLRHTYATILSENDLSLKSIASVMGHRKEAFTADVYTNPEQIVADGISAVNPFLAEVTTQAQAEAIPMTSIFNELLPY